MQRDSMTTNSRLGAGQYNFFAPEARATGNISTAPSSMQKTSNMNNSSTLNTNANHVTQNIESPQQPTPPITPSAIPTGQHNGQNSISQVHAPNLSSDVPPPIFAADMANPLTDPQAYTPATASQIQSQAPIPPPRLYMQLTQPAQTSPIPPPRPSTLTGNAPSSPTIASSIQRRPLLPPRPSTLLPYSTNTPAMTTAKAQAQTISLPGSSAAAGHGHRHEHEAPNTRHTEISRSNISQDLGQGQQNTPVGNSQPPNPQVPSSVPRIVTSLPPSSLPSTSTPTQAQPHSAHLQPQTSAPPNSSTPTTPQQPPPQWSIPQLLAGMHKFIDGVSLQHSFLQSSMLDLTRQRESTAIQLSQQTSNIDSLKAELEACRTQIRILKNANQGLLITLHKDQSDVAQRYQEMKNEKELAAKRAENLQKTVDDIVRGRSAFEAAMSEQKRSLENAIWENQRLKQENDNLKEGAKDLSNVSPDYSMPVVNWMRRERMQYKEELKMIQEQREKILEVQKLPQELEDAKQRIKSLEELVDSVQLARSQLEQSLELERRLRHDQKQSHSQSPSPSEMEGLKTRIKEFEERAKLSTDELEGARETIRLKESQASSREAEIARLEALVASLQAQTQTQTRAENLVVTDQLASTGEVLQQTRQELLEKQVEAAMNASLAQDLQEKLDRLERRSVGTSPPPQPRPRSAPPVVEKKEIGVQVERHPPPKGSKLTSKTKKGDTEKATSNDSPAPTKPMEKPQDKGTENVSKAQDETTPITGQRRSPEKVTNNGKQPQRPNPSPSMRTDKEGVNRRDKVAQKTPATKNPNMASSTTSISPTKGEQRKDKGTEKVTKEDNGKGTPIRSPRPDSLTRTAKEGEKDQDKTSKQKDGAATPLTPALPPQSHQTKEKSTKEGKGADESIPVIDLTKMDDKSSTASQSTPQIVDKSKSKSTEGFEKYNDLKGIFDRLGFSSRDARMFIQSSTDIECPDISDGSSSPASFAESDDSEYTGPPGLRAKQTARKSTGGKRPRSFQSIASRSSQASHKPQNPSSLSKSASVAASPSQGPSSALPAVPRSQSASSSNSFLAKKRKMATEGGSAQKKAKHSDAQNPS